MTEDPKFPTFGPNFDPEPDSKLGAVIRREQGLLTPEELAAMLNIKESTLRVWRMRGTGPSFIKVGHKTVYYRSSDIHAWLDSQIRTKNKENSTQETKQQVPSPEQ